MARGRKESGEDGAGIRLLTTLAGGALLVVLGFGVGLGVGVASEEPDLVMNHLAGRTTDVPLAAPVESAGSPTAPGEATDQPAVGAGSPLGADHTLPPLRGGFQVQVGAFGDDPSANELARALGTRGYAAFVHEEAAGPARFKVRVGPFVSREEATRVSERLKSEQRLPTWVVSPQR